MHGSEVDAAGKTTTSLPAVLMAIGGRIWPNDQIQCSSSEQVGGADERLGGCVCNG